MGIGTTGEPGTNKRTAGAAGKDVQPKRPSESAVETVLMAVPSDANSLGIVHGGRALYLMDEAAGICAGRHAGSRAVTVAADDVRFHRRIEIGSVMVVTAHIVSIGRSSMTIETSVYTERQPSGEREEAVSATFTYVGIDEHGRPAPVPPLLLETDEGGSAKWSEQRN